MTRIQLNLKKLEPKEKEKIEVKGGDNMSKNKEILRSKVDSSRISNVAYDPTKQILEIEYKRGGTYQYKDVPLRIFNELVSAKSVGKYFQAMIKPFYQYRKL